MSILPPPLGYQESSQAIPKKGGLYYTKKILLRVLPFFIKSTMFFFVALFLIGIVAGIGAAFSAKIPAEVTVSNMNKQYYAMIKAVEDSIGVDSKGKIPTFDKNIFVLTFRGDIAASALGGLRKEISIMLQTAKTTDEVIVVLESGGGFVHSYGLAASQLKRIKDVGIPLTIIVDKVAASGGYMMACMADTLIAAPFAILGSIGVVAEFPNFSGWMQKHGIGYDQYTSGEYKRTVSPFTKPTKKAERKVQSDLKQIHKLFKDLVLEHRPHLDIKKVSTGEIWYGSDALENNLIDTIATSDEILISRMMEANVYRVKYLPSSSMAERIAESASIFSEKIFLKISENYMNNL